MASQADGDINPMPKTYQDWIWYWLFSGADTQTYQQELANIEADASNCYTAQQLQELSWKATVLEKLYQRHQES